jgi:hypothetical protein
MFDPRQSLQELHCAAVCVITVITKLSTKIVARKKELEEKKSSIFALPLHVNANVQLL